jgi:hypothetical protein
VPAKLLVQIVGEATSAVSAFKKTEAASKDATGAATKTGSSIAGVAKAVATGYAVTKIVEFGKTTVKAAEESAVAHNRLVSTFKASGDASGKAAADAEKYAGALSKATGVDDELIMGAQAILATFHSLTGPTAKQADLFNRATAAAADLAAAGFGDLNSNAVQLGKALEDPTKGMTALAKSGVTFTAAQKEQIKNMQKTGDLLGAQKVVMAAVEGQVKGTAAATATGSAKMAVAWGNLQESIGTAFLPAVNAIMPAFARLFDFIGANSSWLVPIVVAIGSFAAAMVVVGKAISLFKTALAGAKIAVAGFRLVWLALNSTFLASPIGLIIVGIVALVAVIVLIATKTTWFQTIFRAMTNAVMAGWNAILGAGKAVWNWIKGNWPLLLGILIGPFGLAVALIMRYWSGITGFFSGIVSSIGGVFSRVISLITAPFITAFNIVKGAVDAALGWISARVSSVMAFVNWSLGAAKSVYNTFARTWNAIEVKMPEIDTHIPGVGKVGGFTLGLPDLPILAAGGLMTRSGLIYAHAGEVITPAPAAARGPLVQIAHAHFSERVDVDAFGKRLAWQVETAGV